MNGRLKITPGGFIVLGVFFPFFKNIVVSTSKSQFISVGCLIILSVLFFFRREFREFKLPNLGLIYLFVFLAVLVGSLYFESDSARTLSDSFRYAVFSYFIFLGYNFNKASDHDFFHLICGIAVLQVVFSLLVFFPPAHGLIDFFKGRLSTDSLSFHFYRFSGSLGYPTEFGCFLLLPIFYFISNNLFVRNQRYFALFVFLCLGVIFSVSRGALLALGIFVVGNFLSRLLRVLVSQKLNWRVALLYCLAGLFTLLMVVYFRSLSGTESLSFFGYVSSVVNGLDSSILHRFRELELSLLILMGELSVPTSIERVAPFGLEQLESFWGASLIRFGWLGVLIIVLINTSFVTKILQLSRSQRNSFSASVLVWFAMMYFFVAPFSEVIFRSKGSVIFGLILGVSLSCLREISFRKYFSEDPSRIAAPSQLA